MILRDLQIDKDLFFINKDFYKGKSLMLKDVLLFSGIIFLVL